MPTYGATDVVAVILLAACALPWSNLAWRALVYSVKKASKWSFAYVMAAAAVAFLQYSTTYLAIKARTDIVLNDVFYNTFKNALSAFLRLTTRNSAGEL